MNLELDLAGNCRGTRRNWCVSMMNSNWNWNCELHLAQESVRQQEFKEREGRIGGKRKVYLEIEVVHWYQHEELELDLEGTVKCFSRRKWRQHDENEFKELQRNANYTPSCWHEAGKLELQIHWNTKCISLVGAGAPA